MNKIFKKFYYILNIKNKLKKRFLYIKIIINNKIFIFIKIFYGLKNNYNYYISIN